MLTVNEVNRLSGVSVRTLHHYDAIGLLRPSKKSAAGYRFYDDGALERLQQILLFRELENLLTFARGLRLAGTRKVEKMDFTAFDTRKIDEYAQRAKEAWGQSEAYREFEGKSKNRSVGEEQRLAADMMEIFREFGQMLGMDAGSDSVQLQVKKLQEHITEHYYRCTGAILAGLGQMYAGGGEFTDNIDAWGGAGTAAFVDQAIQIYCGK